MKALATLSMGGIVVGAMAMGCSSSDDPPPADPLATESGFCVELAKVICQDAVVESCYGSAASTLEDDKKTCLENAETKFCNAANLVYRPAGAQECIDSYKAAYDEAELNQAELDNLAKACHKTLSGSAVKGESCEVDSDCNGADGLYCVIKPGAEGTCQVPEEIDPGLDCGSANQVCVDGFFCSSDADACIAERDVGDECSEAQPCNAEALCDDATTMCVAKKANGNECTRNEECSGGFCDINAGDIDGRCRATLPVTVANGQCDDLLPG
jgi:hypothetical protein